YLTFAAESDIGARKAELTAVFTELGYEAVTITSDFERQIEAEILRDVDLMRQDRERDEAKSQAETLDTGLPGQADFDKRLAEAIVGKSDKRFTVDIEALQVAFSKALAK